MSEQQASGLTVRELWRFPVKSVGGERIAVATVTDVGILGDRGWGIYDVATETVLTARRTPELLFASAALTGAGVTMTLPDGSQVESMDQTCDDALSDWLGRTVELRAAGASGGTYECPVALAEDEDWVSWQGPGMAWHDSKRSRLSLVSRSTLGEWEPQRFRTNVILDGAGEDELVGQRVVLGSTELSVMKAIDRCIMVTRAQPGIDRDLDVLKSIMAERANMLAIGALVETEGVISEGDALLVAASS